MVNQYGNEAPGAPSLQAELIKLREENMALKCSGKGDPFLVTIKYLFCVNFMVCIAYCVKICVVAGVIKE